MCSPANITRSIHQGISYYKTIYETFDILVRGLLSLRYCDSFEYSYVGGYVYDCKKYMKKRKWLDDGVNDQFTEIIAKYYEPGSDGYEWIL